MGRVRGSGRRALVAAMALVGSVTVAGGSPAAGGEPGPSSGTGAGAGPPRLEVVPSQDLVEMGPVQITVTGAPDGVRLHRCALPLGADLQGSRCDVGAALPLDDTGSIEYYTQVSAVADVPGSEALDCRAEDCALVLFDASGTPLGRPVPLSFAPPPSVTLEPSEGLLDGQDMTLVAEHFYPGAEYALARCVDWERCIQIDVLTVGPDRRMEATVAAHQELTLDDGPPVYCRANCRLLLLQRETGVSYWFPYAMAEGELSVAPATGLDDGQEVQVTGTELMRTYAGVPAGPFATGGWALTQCDRAVLDQADLLGVFTHCSAPPLTRGVTVEGSTLDTTFQARATITRILGGTTDCTAAPDACVVGLARLEQDLSLTTHLVPVSFG